MAKTLHNSCLLPGIHFTMYTQGVSIRGYFFILVSKGSLHILLRKIYKEQPTHCQNYFIFHVEQKPNFISFHLLVFFHFVLWSSWLSQLGQNKRSSLEERNALLFSFCQLFPSTFARRICTANSKAIKAWNTPSQARRGSQIKFSIVFKMCYLIM